MSENDARRLSGTNARRPASSVASAISSNISSLDMITFLVPPRARQSGVPCRPMAVVSGVSDGGRVGGGARFPTRGEIVAGGARARPAWVEQASHPRPIARLCDTTATRHNFVVLDKRALPASSFGGYERRKRGLSQGRVLHVGSPKRSSAGPSNGYRFLIYSIPLRQSGAWVGNGRASRTSSAPNKSRRALVLARDGRMAFLRTSSR